MNRYKAAGIHACLSMAAATMAAVMLLFFWYPYPYFLAAHADALVGLLFGVDLTLGPLLTLIVFKSGKPSLRFDLTCIGVAQAIAMTYGLFIMSQARPVFLVGAVDRFILVTAADLKAVPASSFPARFAHLSWSGPTPVIATIPEDAAKRNALLFSAAAGRDIELFPQYYHDFASHIGAMLPRAGTLDMLAANRPRLAAAIASHERTVPRADIAWFPLTVHSGRYLVFVVDRRTGKPLGAFMAPPSESGWLAPPRPQAGK